MPLSSSGGPSRLSGHHSFISLLISFFSFSLYESLALSLGRTSSQTPEWNEDGGKILPAVLGEEELLVPSVREGRSAAPAKIEDRLSRLLKTEDVYSQEIFLQLPESRAASRVTGQDFFPAGYHHDGEKDRVIQMESVLRDGTPRHNNPSESPLGVFPSLRTASTSHAKLDRKTLLKRSFMINFFDIKKRLDSHGEVEFTDLEGDIGEGTDAANSMIDRSAPHDAEDAGRDALSVSRKASFLTLDQEVFVHDLKPPKTILLSSEEEARSAEDVIHSGTGVEEAFSASDKNSVVRVKKEDNEEADGEKRSDLIPKKTSVPQQPQVNLHSPSSNFTTFSSSSSLSSSFSLSHAFVDTSSDLPSDIPFVDDNPQEIEEEVNLATALSRAGAQTRDEQSSSDKPPRDKGRPRGGGDPTDSRRSRRRSEGNLDAVRQGGAEGHLALLTKRTEEPAKQPRASRRLSLHSAAQPRQRARSESDIFAMKADELLQRQAEESATLPEIQHGGKGSGRSERSTNRRSSPRTGNQEDKNKDVFTREAEEFLQIEESGQTYPPPPGLVFPSPLEFRRLNFVLREDLSAARPSDSTVVSYAPEEAAKSQAESSSKQTGTAETNSRESRPENRGEPTSPSPPSSPLSLPPHFESWSTEEIKAYGDQFYDEMSMRLGRYKRAAEATRRRTARTEADEVRGDRYSIYLCQQLRPLNVPSLDNNPYLSRLGRMFHRLDQSLSRATKAVSVASTKILRWLKKRLRSEDGGKQKQQGKVTLFLKKLSAYVTAKVMSIATKITAQLIRYMPTILFFVQIFLLISASSAVATGPGVLAIIALVSSIASLLAFLVSQGTELNQQHFAEEIFSSLSPNSNLQTFGLLWADVRAEQIVHTATTPKPIDPDSPATGEGAGRGESLEEEEEEDEFLSSSLFSSFRSNDAHHDDGDLGDGRHHSRRTRAGASSRGGVSSFSCEGTSPPPYLDEVTAALRAANEIRNARDSALAEDEVSGRAGEEGKEERAFAQRGRTLMRRNAKRMKKISGRKEAPREGEQGSSSSSSPGGGEERTRRVSEKDEVDFGRHRRKDGEEQQRGKTSGPPKTDEELLRERLEEIRRRMKENLTQVTYKEKMARRKQRIKETWQDKRFKGAGVIVLTALRMMFSSVNHGVRLLLRAFGSAWTFVVVSLRLSPSIYTRETEREIGSNWGEQTIESHLRLRCSHLLPSRPLHFTGYLQR